MTGRAPGLCSATCTGGGHAIARPASQIANGDFEQGLASWRVVSGTAFDRQPVSAASITAADVEFDGKTPVTLGGDFWHTPYNLGQSGSSLIRVVSSADGVLDSSPFSIGDRYLAFRLGGSAGGGAVVQLRIPAAAATALRIKVLDAPDADGDVAVMQATPHGADPMDEVTWDLARLQERGRGRLLGIVAKVRLEVRQRPAPQRLLADDFRLLPSPPAPLRRPLWGWADIHCHPMSQAAFGGLMAGHMHGPVEDLGSCLPVHGDHHNNLLRPAALSVGSGQPNDGSLAVSGWTGLTPGPEDQLAFRGWPSFSDLAHIKTHQAWIRRAYEGGQRLMVALVVHNRMLSALANLTTPGYVAQSDRDTVEPQIQMLREFVAHNGDWCGMACTPDDARALIEGNKMAFVLGLETDSVNDWIKSSDFAADDTPANRQAIHDAIHGYFDYLHALGVVQINLLHLSDNAFGGMAVYDVMFIVNSLYQRGIAPKTNLWQGSNPDEAVARPASVGGALWSKIRTLAASHGLNPPASGGRPFGVGDVNAHGLTIAGEVAMLEAMRLGMVIDIDHMSELSEARAFQIATSTVAGASYPLVAAHNSARILAPRPLDSSVTPDPMPGFRRSAAVWPCENNKSETHLDHITSTKGMFGLGIAGADSRAASGTSVPNNLPGSSRTFAQGYQYLFGRLEMPVALGTDWNALLEGPGPRFGPLAGNGIVGELAEGDATWQGKVREERWQGALAQGTGVNYDTPIREWRSFRFADADLFVGTPVEGIGQQTWQALAVLDAGVSLTDPHVVAELTPTGSTTSPVLELASGISGAAGTVALPAAAGVSLARAAFLAAHPGSASPVDGAAVVALADGIAAILGLWAAMHASTAPPLRRDTVGPMRDFDYNIDGLAHYGLLPDMFQDLKNVGLTGGAMSALFSSAERYVEVWERCVATAAQIPH